MLESLIPREENKPFDMRAVVERVVDADSFFEVKKRFAGEILTGIGGHPSMRIAPVDETNEHSVQAILEESYAHESAAIEKYSRLVELTSGKSVFMEEYARSMVATEEEHVMELRKMLRDLQ